MSALMNEYEAAEYLGMSVHWLRKLRTDYNRKGRRYGPPYIKMGHTVRYMASDLDLWIKQHTVAAEKGDIRR